MGTPVAKGCLGVGILMLLAYLVHHKARPHLAAQSDWAKEKLFQEPVQNHDPFACHRKCILDEAEGKETQDESKAFFKKLPITVNDCLDKHSILKPDNFDSFYMGRLGEHKYFLKPSLEKQSGEECKYLTIGIGGAWEAEKQFRAKYPHCKVFGIEPMPDQYPHFEEFGTVIPHPVGATKGNASLVVRKAISLEDTGNPGDLPRTIFRQLLLAVQYLHHNGIAHRDIKCENVFLTDTLTAKLGDFGFSRLQGMGQLSHTFCGSRPYAAPELVRRLPYRGQPADWWSLGIVLFIMLEARLPFDDRNVPRMLQRQDEQALHFINCPFGDARRLIRAFLQPVVANRICATAALLHPWFFIANPNANLPQP